MKKLIPAFLFFLFLSTKFVFGSIENTNSNFTKMEELPEEEIKDISKDNEAKLKFENECENLEKAIKKQEMMNAVKAIKELKKKELYKNMKQDLQNLEQNLEEKEVNIQKYVEKENKLQIQIDENNILTAEKRKEMQKMKDDLSKEFEKQEKVKQNLQNEIDVCETEFWSINTEQHEAEMLENVKLKYIEELIAKEEELKKIKLKNQGMEEEIKRKKAINLQLEREGKKYHFYLEEDDTQKFL
jgi:hypothetical protein